MKKLAVGLTSVPFSGPPADTATSAKTDIEDEEVSNKTGFGQFETNLPLTIDFSKLKEVDMNSEIKKLEAALSGIGYNIKLASEDVSEAAPDGINFVGGAGCQIDKEYCIWLPVKPNAIPGYKFTMAPAMYGKCTSSFVRGKFDDQESVISILGKARYLFLLKQDMSMVLERGNLVSISQIGNNTELVLDEDYEYITHWDTETQSVVNDILKLIINKDGASVNPGAASTKNNSKSTSKTAPTPTAIKFPNGTTLNDRDWSYTVNGPYEVRVVKKDGTRDTVLTSSYKNWNKFAATLNNMPQPVVSDPAQLSVKEDSEPVAPPSTPQQQPQQPATSGSVTELLNGKKVVTVGASGPAGGDIIMLDVESVNAGAPKFYIKDGKTGKVAEMGANDGRVRGAISRADARRLAASLKAQGVSDQKISAFLELMKLERRNKRIPFGRKKREDNMNIQKQRMRANSADDAAVEKLARDMRISRLEKKGIL